MNTPRSLMIGDHAEIIVGDIGYRYFIITINAVGITIAQMSDSSQTVLLVKNTQGVWQADGYNVAHIVKFSRNDTDTKYIDHDFYQLPNKIIKIKQAEFSSPVIELRNGLILYQLKDMQPYRGTLACADPSYAKSLDDYSIPRSIELVQAKTFMEVPLFNNRTYRIMDFNDEIFVINPDTQKIDKLNLNDFALTAYADIPQDTFVFPLRSRMLKLLYINKKLGTMSIWDDATHRMLNVDTRRSSFNYNALNLDVNALIYQMSSGDIILNYRQTVSSNAQTEFYRINIYNGDLTHLSSFDGSLGLIAILPDNSFLLLNSTSSQIQLWDTNANGQITTIASTNKLRQHPNFESILLHNGDVIYYLLNKYYLFNYIMKEIKELFNFDNIYTERPAYICQLKNGNLMINGSVNGLSVIEFPVNKPYDTRKSFGHIYQNHLI